LKYKNKKYRIKLENDGKREGNKKKGKY